MRWFFVPPLLLPLPVESANVSPKDRHGRDRSLGIGDEELRRMHKTQWGNLFFSGPGLQNGVVALRTEHSSRRTNQKSPRRSPEKRRTMSGLVRSCTDHDPHPAVRSLKYRGTCPPGMLRTDSCCNFLLAILADQLPLGTEQHSRVVTGPIRPPPSSRAIRWTFQLLRQVGQPSGSRPLLESAHPNPGKSPAESICRQIA